VNVPSAKDMAAKNALQLRKAVRLVWDSAPSWTLASGVLIFINSALTLAALYLMKLIVDAVSGTATPAWVLFLVALAGLIALLNVAASSVNSIIRASQSALVTDHIQEILHAKSVEVDLEYYENSRYYETLHRAQSQAISRPNQIVEGLFQLGQSCLSLAAVVGLMISLSWVVALVILVTGLPTAYVRWKYSRKLYQMQMDYTIKERKAWYHHWLLTSSDYAKEVRLFDLGSKFINRYRDLREELRDQSLSLIKRRSSADLITQSVGIAAVFGSLAYIANQTLLGIITVGEMVMFFGAVQQSRSLLNSFFFSLIGLYENNLFLTDLYEFLNLEPRVSQPIRPQPIPRPVRDGIHFHNVSFGYIGSDRLVLNGINLAIGPGETVALVGENGSGKTTLVKLLCRLYDPTSGEITLDGIDLREFKTTDLRGDIGVLFQDFARYNFTARENIVLGRSDLPSDEEVMKAAEFSGATSFISRLENGYSTVLGKWFDEGTELSVGEWQKVALARAFIRDAQIIILDEPTSSLDPYAEDDVICKFKDLARGKMSLIISHRLSTASIADRIYFMNAGYVVESGTHRELMDKGGRYAQMFEVQARHYRECDTGND
jgi:ATP-binding cassette, subfamily B, bacterial